jgi:3-methyladenine DNA glycosylase AlkD
VASSKANDFKKELQKHASADDAAFLQQFFKTGEGQYGAGDVFVGVRVPATRAVCKRFRDMPLGEIKKLLASPVHEHRLGAVILLDAQYKAGDDQTKQQVYDLYMQAVHDGQVNNWDIVDSSAPYIVGRYLLDRPRNVLITLAHSDQLWERRVSALATFWFLKEGDPSTTLEIAEILLHDPHDLIQKAVGWMLRELGKQVDSKLLVQFLDKHAHEMPRTMLRYSIERLTPGQRIHYLALKK